MCIFLDLIFFLAPDIFLGANRIFVAIRPGSCPDRIAPLPEPLGQQIESGIGFSENSEAKPEFFFHEVYIDDVEHVKNKNALDSLNEISAGILEKRKKEEMERE